MILKDTILIHITYSIVAFENLKVCFQISYSNDIFSI